MAVKPLQSLQRALSVIEAIAANQPIGVAALARLLGEDKSAVQRDLMTLADAGWIRAARSALRITACCAGPFGTVRPLLAPSWLTAVA